MGVYSTVDITEDQLREEIKKRFDRIDEMSRARLVEILEAMVQIRDYDEMIDDDFAWNNFWATN